MHLRRVWESIESCLYFNCCCCWWPRAQKFVSLVGYRAEHGNLPKKDCALNACLCWVRAPVVWRRRHRHRTVRVRIRGRRGKYLGEWLFYSVIRGGFWRFDLCFNVENYLFWFSLVLSHFRRCNSFQFEIVSCRLSFICTTMPCSTMDSPKIT